MVEATRLEILTVSALAAFLGWLWFRNRSNGAGTGYQPVEASGAGDAAVLPTLDDLHMPSLPGGTILNLHVADTPLPPAPSPYAAGQVNSCGCDAGNGQFRTFGSLTDLAVFLGANPPIPEDFEAGMKSWVNQR